MAWEIASRGLDGQKTAFLPSSNHRESNTSMALYEGIKKGQQEIQGTVEER